MPNEFERYALGSPDALAWTDAGGSLGFANQAFADAFLPGATDVRGARLEDMAVSEPLIRALLRGVESCCRGGGEERFSCEERLHGERRRLACRVMPGGDQGPARALVEFRDQGPADAGARDNGRLTRQQARDLQEQSRRLFFSALDEFPTFIYMQRQNYTVAYANKKVRKLYGDPEGRLCYEVFAGRSEPCPVCPTFEVFETGKPVEWEFIDNQERSFRIYDYPFRDVTGEPLVMELGIDVTDLKRVEKDLFQAQKLRAIGVLAGGIAHDLNNNLVPIIFNIDHALNKIGDKDVREPLSEALQAAYKAARLVEQVLEYSRQQDVSRSPLHLKPLVREALEIFEAAKPGGVDLDVSLNLSRDSVSANPAQIQQLLLNLLRNAEQAMPDGGVIEVRLGEVTVRPLEKPPHPELSPGQYAVLAIRDSGLGIEPENLEHIFEPFYSSRKLSGANTGAGKTVGTGMGLAVVHSIVTGSGGAMTVDSSPGRGATFTAYLPKAPELGARLEGEPCLIRGVQGCLLLVDDDPGALSAMSRILREAGYEVDAVRSAEEGLAAYADDPERYGLVLLDQTMPGMTGVEMSARLLETRGNANIVICTGYIDPETEKQARQAGVAGFAMKPMTPYTLVDMVRRHSR